MARICPLPQLVHYAPYNNFIDGAIVLHAKRFVNQYLPILEDYLKRIEEELKGDKTRMCSKEVLRPRSKESPFTLRDLLETCSQEIQMLTKDLQFYDRLPSVKVFEAVFPTAFHAYMTSDYKESFLSGGGLINYIRSILTILQDYMSVYRAQKSLAGHFREIERGLFAQLSFDAKAMIARVSTTRSLLSHEALDETGEFDYNEMGKMILAFKELDEKYLVPLIKCCQRLGMETVISKYDAGNGNTTQDDRTLTEEKKVKEGSTAAFLSELSDDRTGKTEAKPASEGKVGSSQEGREKKRSLNEEETYDGTPQGKIAKTGDTFNHGQ